MLASKCSCFSVISLFSLGFRLFSGVLFLFDGLSCVCLLLYVLCCGFVLVYGVLIGGVVLLWCCLFVVIFIALFSLCVRVFVGVGGLFYVFALVSVVSGCVVWLLGVSCVCVAKRFGTILLRRQVRIKCLNVYSMFAGWCVHWYVCGCG